MNGRLSGHVNRVLGTAGIVAVVAAAARLAAAPTSEYTPEPLPAFSVTIDSLEPEPDASPLEGQDPFRLSGRPSSVRHGESPPEPQPVSAPYRPSLQLRAIVGGPPWLALVRGIPGRAGDAMLGAGDRADSLVVRSVTRDRVVLDGSDTTWVLTLGPDRP